MPGILLVHVLVLALILLTPSSLAVAPALVTPLSVFNVVAADRLPPAKVQPEPPRTPHPSPMVDLQIETPLEASPPVFSAAAAEQAGFGTSCELAELLGRAFTENPLLRAQLARIGPDARSVANAIMFWDGRWVEVEGRAPEDAITLLRRAIVEAVRAAPPECLGQDVAGPRFIPVKDAEGTIILVLGSATWRWEQLLSEDPAANGSRQNNTDEEERPRAAGISQIFEEQ
jgi:hypothetical protein